MNHTPSGTNSPVTKGDVKPPQGSTVLSIKPESIKAEDIKREIKVEDGSTAAAAQAKPLKGGKEEEYDSSATVRSV
jgi:hypothetical protein